MTRANPQQNDVQSVSSPSKPGTTLAQRAVRGGMWVFAIRILDRFFRLARTIVLARMLAPEDFGLFGIVLLAMSTMATFTRTGFKAALVQKKADVTSYLDTAWTVQVVRGCLVFVILFGGAGYIVDFFGEPAAGPMLRVLALSFLVRSFINIGVMYFQKELEFRKQFVFQLSGTLADFGVAIVAAVLLQSAWALVYGQLAGYSVRMVVSYWVHPYRPRIRFQSQKARELYSFGRWVFGSSLVVFLLNHGDDLFVGKVLGATALGIYQLAYRISNLPATEITSVLSKVSFPVYSKLQDRPLRLRTAYLETMKIVTLVSLPISGGIFFLSSSFTQVFLGEQWMPMVPLMQVLVLWGLIRSISATTGPLFKAIGRPDYAMYFQLARLAVLVVTIYPFSVRWGSLGIALAVVGSAIIVDPFPVYLALRMTGGRVRELMGILLYPSLGTVVICMGLFGAQNWLLSSVTLPSFIMLVLISVLLYAGMAWWLDSKFDYGIQTMFKKRFAGAVQK